MNANKRLLVSIIATVSVLGSIGAVSAESEHRRGDGDKDRDKEACTHSTKPAEDKPSRPQAKPRSGVGDYRPYNERNNEPMSFTGTIGRSVPITPSARQQGSYRTIDRARNPERPGVTYSSPNYRTHRTGSYSRYSEGWPSVHNFPCNYGHWTFSNGSGSRRSMYYHYGYFPYISSSSVSVQSYTASPYVEVSVVLSTVNSGGGYYLTRPATDTIESAVADIRFAWIDQSPDQLLRHVRTGDKIDVLLDGSYSYTVSADDYIAMTQDAINATQTVDFTLESLRKRGDDKYILYGKHLFYGPNGDLSVAYVSYLIEKRAGVWAITEVGSSQTRIGA